MDAISRTTYSNIFPRMKSCVLLLEFLWNLYLKGPINNKSALVLVMAWRRTDDKPWPEPMMTNFTDAYKWHNGEMSWEDFESLNSLQTRARFQRNYDVITRLHNMMTLTPEADMLLWISNYPHCILWGVIAYLRSRFLSYGRIINSKHQSNRIITISIQSTFEVTKQFSSRQMKNIVGYWLAYWNKGGRKS